MICLNTILKLTHTMWPTEILATSNMAASAMLLAVSFSSAPLRDNSSSTTWMKAKNSWNKIIHKIKWLQIPAFPKLEEIRSLLLSPIGCQIQWVCDSQVVERRCPATNCGARYKTQRYFVPRSWICTLTHLQNKSKYSQRQQYNPHNNLMLISPDCE